MRQKVTFLDTALGEFNKICPKNPPEKYHEMTPLIITEADFSLLELPTSCFYCGFTKLAKPCRSLTFGAKIRHQLLGKALHF